MERKTIFLAAGGTGGHLFPAQQLGGVLDGDLDVIFIGHGLSKTSFFDQHLHRFEEVNAAPLGKSFLIETWKGFWKSIRLIHRGKPSVVVGFGSYHTFPVLLAALVLRKKIVLFEANQRLGKVNRLFAPFASSICTQFNISCKRGALVPLLPWKATEIGSFSKEEARKLYGLDPQVFTILVFGGSQGALFFNQMIPKLNFAVGFPVQVIHLTGKTSGIERSYAINSSVKIFETQMHQAYLAADLAICRSGASTIAELIQHTLPALLIPFPFAVDDHQKTNALFMQNEVGGAVCLDQKEANLDSIQTAIQQLIRELEIKKQNLLRYKESASLRASMKEQIQKMII